MQMSPWYAVNLALLFPGLGHLYGGKYLRGALWLGLGLTLLGLTLWSFLGATGNVQVGAGCLGTGTVLWVFSVIDSYSCLTLPNGSSQTFRSFSSQVAEGQAPKDLWFPVFLSQLLPGLGQLYSHQLGVGTLFLLLTFGLVGAAALFSKLLVSLGCLSAIAAAQLIWQQSRNAALAHQPQSTQVTAPAAAPRPATATLRQAGTITPVLSRMSPAAGRTPHRSQTRTVLRQGLGLVLLIFVARSLLLGFPPLVQQWIEPFAVPSESMAPTLQVGDRILVDKSANYEPQLQDIIVFRSQKQVAEDGRVQEGPAEIFFVKRVIGLPGDHLEVKNGQVWRNGQPLQEPYLAEAIAYELAPQTLPQDSYFVLGDNRNASFDSHVWGAISSQDIVGQVYRISWPPERNQALGSRQ